MTPRQKVTDEDDEIIQLLLETDLAPVGLDSGAVRAAIGRLRAQPERDNGATVATERLLTTTQAAQLLGIQSSNTIKNWVRSGYLHGVRRGARVLIPNSEIARIRDGDRVLRVRHTEQLLDASAALGEDDPSDEIIRELEEGRPGTLPWHRADTSRD